MYGLILFILPLNLTPSPSIWMLPLHSTFSLVLADAPAHLSCQSVTRGVFAERARPQVAVFWRRRSLRQKTESVFIYSSVMKQPECHRQQREREREREESGTEQTWQPAAVIVSAVKHSVTNTQITEKYKYDWDDSRVQKVLPTNNNNYDLFWKAPQLEILLVQRNFLPSCNIKLTFSAGPSTHILL